MKAFVVMTTYKSNPVFLKKQLDSLRDQERKADGVFILDDCSNDGTYESIKEYIYINGLDTWNVISQEKNTGYKVAFMNALKWFAENVKENVLVFLADHDDIWKSSKIKTLVELMEYNSEIKLLGSNSIKIDVDDKIISDIYISNVDDLTNVGDNLYKFSFDTLLKGGRFQGCVSVLRTEILDSFFRLFSESLPHDYQLDLAACFVDGLYFYNDAFTLYRIHENQQIGCGKTRNMLVKEGRLEYIKELYFFYYEVSKLLLKYGVKENSFNRRLSVYESRFKILSEWGKLRSLFWVISSINILFKDNYLRDVLIDVWVTIKD